jgi:type I restriction-modification system DNA methylase subunit
MACLAPQPGETLIDPACGTGGFLIAMYLYIVNTFPAMTREQRDHLRHQALHGVDIVQSVIRLCAMNLLLHNVGPTAAQLDARRRQLLEGGLPADQVDAQLDALLPVRTDDALLDSDNLPDPDRIAAEIADDLRSALEQMEALLADL